MIDLKTIEDIESNENWFSMPSESNWYDAMQFVLEKLQSTSNKVANSILNKIKAVVYVLINDGNTYESIVIKTAILYLFAKSTGFNISDLENEFDKFTLDGVKVLVDSENNNYLKNVFEGNIEYLHKIKLAEFVVEAQALQKTTNLKEKLVNIKFYNKIVKDYEGKTHRGLMNLLKSLI